MHGIFNGPLSRLFQDHFGLTENAIFVDEILPGVICEELIEEIEAWRMLSPHVPHSLIIGDTTLFVTKSTLLLKSDYTIYGALVLGHYCPTPSSKRSFVGFIWEAGVDNITVVVAWHASQ